MRKSTLRHTATHDNTDRTFPRARSTLLAAGMVKLKLTFLAKRRPMGRDLMTSPYGRFFHLPRELARRGHEVHLHLFSYERDEPESAVIEGVSITSVSAWPTGPVDYVRSAAALVGAVDPDWVIGLSDRYYGILAAKLGARQGASVAIDAYDNYEAYSPALEWINKAWRRALSRADLLTAAGPTLLELMSASGSQAACAVVPMAADPIGFGAWNRKAARQRLGLPLGETLIGYAGSIHPSRGLEVLFEAYSLLAERHASMTLVLSGRRTRGVRLPDRARWLGILPTAEVPAMFSAIDLLAVINRRSEFGDHSHPVKLYEGMASGIRVVATRTPATEWILKDALHCLVEAGDPSSLAEGIEALLARKPPDYGAQPTWQTSAIAYEQALLSALNLPAP